MVLMLQYEAAQRFQAACGTKHYSAISIRLQSAYRLSALHKVSGRCFFPVPAVDSALVHWELLPQPHLLAPRVHDFIRHVFMRRRKQIKHLCHTLPQYADLWEPWLCTLPGPTLRPEAIALKDWQRLGLLPSGSIQPGCSTYPR
jgi:16S rRNA (adenine1518-N6/adenine1519-N6)-dimethyltransferase